MIAFDSVADVMEACRKDGQALLVFEDRVLDVAKFSHPGPQSLITSNIGKDITQAFSKQGHSSYARSLCERMVVGSVGPGVEAGKLLPNPFVASDLTEEERQVHARLDSLIDISKPLLPQVSQLSNREFKALISRPRYMENEDGIQLFADPAVDANAKRSLGRTVQSISPVVLLILFLGWRAAPSLPAFAFNLAVCFPAGFALMWTATEYYFHRLMPRRSWSLANDAKADPQFL